MLGGLLITISQVTLHVVRLHVVQNYACYTVSYSLSRDNFFFPQVIDAPDLLRYI